MRLWAHSGTSSTIFVTPPWLCAVALARGRRCDRSWSRVMRRRGVLLRGTGRSTQLPGRVRKESTAFGAFMGFEHHFGGVVAVSGGKLAPATPPTWCWTPMSASKGMMLTRTHPGNWVGRPPPPPTVRPSSSGDDYNCGRNAATSEFHCAQPRRVTKMVLDAPECVQRRTFDAHPPR